jgi:hypothetical protein
MASKDKGRRKPRRKVKAKLVLHAAFHGWEDDDRPALEKRIDDLRHVTASTHRFIEPEWIELDKMREKLKALEKFERAARELAAKKPGCGAAGPSR